MRNQENGSSSNSIHYIMYTILSLSLLIAIFFNFTQDKDPIIEKIEIAKCEKFEDLPKDTQLSYISKEEKLKQDIIYAKNLVATLAYMNEPSSSHAQPLEQKEKSKKIDVKPKDVTMAKDFAKCYNLKEGDYIINNKCKKNIINYVKKHQDAKYFEIIGIVDDAEFKLYNNLEKNDSIYDRLGVTKNHIATMKKMSESGLAEHRVIEANWLVKTNTNPRAVTYNPQYHITSTQGKRGMLVRAFE